MGTNLEISNRLKFSIQGTHHVVEITEDMDPSLSLNSYIRDKLNLKGTKHMCLEGGCGACVVVLHRDDKYLAVNSCLVSLLSCHGWNLLTIEGIGGPLTNYHPIQEKLADFNGTQCGFCSPGMVMNMYALYESKKDNLSKQDVENAFGGNICRCTGYRPILDAFKQFCTPKQTTDIEDITICDKACIKLESAPFYHSLGDGTKWVKVYVLADLLNTLKANQNQSYMLVGGNTAKGVFSEYGSLVNLYVDISEVKELKEIASTADSLVFGASNSLTTAIEQFTSLSQNNAKYSYLSKLADHIDLIANVPVRNFGTIAGNLMIKHDHNDFPSDIFLILETVGATAIIADINGAETQIPIGTLIKSDMKYKVIRSISFPPYESNVKYESYKIMPRAQNTHANVNAGFLFNFTPTNMIASARIVIGNINASFVHATKTEEFLKGKRFDSTTMNECFDVLSQELIPEDVPPDPSPEFRKQLAVALLYKAILALAPVELTPRIKSGGEKLLRPVSEGHQEFGTKQSLYPVTKDVRKLEALAQTSGQAQYIEDMPPQPHQLYGVFVLAEATPHSTITNIDPAKALALEGVVAFYSASDIPGDNNFAPLDFFPSIEEIFCSRMVLYYDQPIGLIVATSQKKADDAAKLVNVLYDPPKYPTPLLTTRQVLNNERPQEQRVFEVLNHLPSRRGNDVKHTIEGTFDIYHQYHFHMEKQCCNVIPSESGLDMYPSTQSIDLCQVAVAKMLKIPNNQLNINVRRCGGGFGGKITRSPLTACAAALAAWKLKQPVSVSMSLPTNMKVIGKRWPFSMDYEVGVDAKGVIQYLNSTQYVDVGAIYNENENVRQQLSSFLDNYDYSTFQVEANVVKTDTHVNTWTRAPGSTEGLAAIESIMDHIAYTLNIDPLSVREANMGAKNTQLQKYLSDLKSWANIEKRKAEISDFNSSNRWRKKGLSVVPMTYDFEISGIYTAVVTIYHGDGSVAISHGGIEIGQGINTKVAQVCAYKLKIPLDKITILPSNTFNCPNNISTGASLTSEAVCYCVIQACDELLERLSPHRKPIWEETIKMAYSEKVLLSATGIFSDKDPKVSGYLIYGIVATEVTVDILTGQHVIDQVDLIEDGGQVISPLIDIGQVEGAFVMGMGYYTTEKIVFAPNGKLLTTNTWTYHPPGAMDIPVKFNVRFPGNNANAVGVLQSKATGEPPLGLSVSVPLAIRNAVASAREDSQPGVSKWFPFDGPTNVENVFMNSLNSYKQYGF